MGVKNSVTSSSSDVALLSGRGGLFRLSGRGNSRTATGYRTFQIERSIIQHGNIATNTSGVIRKTKLVM